MNGAQLRDWLERAAICFNRLVPGWRDQPLLNPKVAGHNFDIIDGLRYTFDLSAPARFDIAGNLLNPAAHRVVDMRYQGEEVRDGDRFVLAVNSYRAFGGGPYPSPATKQIVYAGHDSIRDLLSRYITENDLSAFSARPIWRFQPMPGSSATFDTGPGAREYLDGLTVFDAEDLGNTPDGFARFRLHL